MSATVAPAPTGASRSVSVPARGRPRSWSDLRAALPTVFTTLNAIAFLLVRPDVNDLWAARARARAVSDGVGLTYWFSWFGGGSTPGNYSVLTPSVSAVVGVEVLGAVGAVAATALATLAVRGTRFPLAAAGVAAFAASLNLWSGRVPFLVGGAIGVGAIIAVRRRNRPATVALTVLSILASPTAGAFICLGLSGTFLTTRTKQWRPIIAYAAVSALLGMIAVALVFGTPGPEPFSALYAGEVLLGLVLLRLARPPDHVRTTLGVCALALLVVFLVPNGLGANFARFVWFCLPVVVVALGGAYSRRVTALLVAPLLAVGLGGTVRDLTNAVRPVSSVSYYHPLARELDKIPDLDRYRVEVVDHGAHAGYDILPDHAMLARGWETQEDNELNAALNADPLSPVTYKVWLDNNAVGYVALPSTKVGSYPEYTLVKEHRISYLHRVWSSPHWQLFRVQHPTPIVASPASVLGHTQSTMTLAVPCACTVNVRVRWSKFLDAQLTPTAATPRGTSRPEPVTAKVEDDGAHWTALTTTQPGRYVLSGSIRGVLR